MDENNFSSEIKSLFKSDSESKEEYKRRVKLYFECKWNHFKSFPLKYKIGIIVGTVLFLWIWGLLTQFFYAVATANIVGMSINILYCFACIFTKGIGYTMLALCVVLGLILAFCLWYWRNHKDEPKTKKVIRNGRFIKVVIDDGTMSTGHEAEIEDLENQYNVTSNVAATTQPIFGKNMIDGRYVIAKNVRPATNRNSIGVGSGGSRKTRGYIVPMISQLAKGGENMVVTDPSGEIFAYTYHLLKQNDYIIQVINTREPTYSNGWNFIKTVGDDFMLAQTFAHTIIENTSGEKADSFWNEQMENLLSAFIVYVNLKYKNNPNKQNIGEVVKLTTMKESELVINFQSVFGEDTDNCHPAMNSFLLYYNSEPKVKSQTRSTLGTRLRIFFIPDMAKMLSTDDIHIEDFADKEKKRIIFIMTSEQDTTFSMIASLFLDASFKLLSDYATKYLPNNLLPRPLHFIFDEFANIGHIQNIGLKLSVSRKYNMIIHMIIQSYPQLVQRYTEEEVGEILSNMKYVLLLLAAENVTAEYFSKLYGEMTALTNQRTTNTPILNETASVRSTTQKRPIFFPNEIMSIGAEYLLLWSADSCVAQLKKVDFTELDEFKNLYAKMGGEQQATFHISKFEGSFNKPSKNKSKNNNNSSSNGNTKSTNGNGQTTNNNSNPHKGQNGGHRDVFSFGTTNDMFQPANAKRGDLRQEEAYSENINVDFEADTVNKFSEAAANVNKDTIGLVIGTKMRLNNKSGGIKENNGNTGTPETISIKKVQGVEVASTEQENTRLDIGLYFRDSSSKFEDKYFTMPHNNKDEQLSLTALFSSGVTLNEINEIPKINKTEVNRKSYIERYKNLIGFNKYNKVIFISNDFREVRGKMVYFLHFVSNAKFISNILPDVQMRAAGELIDISLITAKISNDKNLPNNYYVDHWTMVLNRSGRTEYTDIGEILTMPEENITLIPHFAEKKYK